VSDTPRHSVSVAGIVVRDDGRVLAVRRRDNHHWEPPGGVLELHETFEQGVRREILEETGVEVRVERLTGVYKNISRGIVALVFRCSPVGGRPTPTTEALSVSWLTIEQIRQHMDPAYVVRVTDAFTDEAPARVHDGVNLMHIGFNPSPWSAGSSLRRT
jgi:ADP-ribose pyrophosphatase YjhB (NUDIX family)